LINQLPDCQQVFFSKIRSFPVTKQGHDKVYFINEGTLACQSFFIFFFTAPWSCIFPGIPACKKEIFSLKEQYIYLTYLLVTQELLASTVCPAQEMRLLCGPRLFVKHFLKLFQNKL
ncbi:hypothetical protein, partial [Desulfoplanes sp.]